MPTKGAVVPCPSDVSNRNTRRRRIETHLIVADEVAEEPVNAELRNYVPRLRSKFLYRHRSDPNWRTPHMCCNYFDDHIRLGFRFSTIIQTIDTRANPTGYLSYY